MGVCLEEPPPCDEAVRVCGPGPSACAEENVWLGQVGPGKAPFPRVSLNFLIGPQ